MRRAVLKENAWCSVPGCHNLATDVDHIVRIEDDGDPYDRRNLQALCRRHHSQKTAQETWHRKT